MPRDNDKDNNSRGRRDRPIGRQGPLGRRSGARQEIRQARLCGQGPQQERRRAPSLCRQSATVVRRAAKTAMRRGLGVIGRMATGHREAARARSVRSGRAKIRGGDKRPYTPRGDRPDRDARPAARCSRTRKFGDKKPYTPREAVARSGPTRRAARASARTVIVRRAIVRSMRAADGDRPRWRSASRRSSRAENSMATRSFHAVRAKDFGDVRIAPAIRPRPWRFQAVAEARRGSRDHGGRNARPSRDGARNFDRPRFDKPRYDKPRDGDRGGERTSAVFAPDARIVRQAIVRFATVRNSIGRAGRPALQGRTDWQEHPRSEPRRPGFRSSSPRK